ncbi:hypothetical protein ARALYDRAFT_901385 [Arabidopsis lyrata subsp. lyrata]|uniref:Cyclin C-terminal domain-containing protein n=1 Tax=Arabidopsis lyrata subsp. lyrata TaxID=81972 RepID=D7LDG4_ARALL|nr:hypothetical protein ARALYDRAFT_901385 [Arabidopsis lyrata subsp. lyrata]
MNLITPFHYLKYFLATISPDHSVSKELVLLSSSDSLLALTKEISFTDYRQFVVAVVTIMLATSTSSDIRLTREEIPNKFRSLGGLLMRMYNSCVFYRFDFDCLIIVLANVCPYV